MQYVCWELEVDFVENALFDVDASRRLVPLRHAEGRVGQSRNRAWNEYRAFVV